MLRKCLYRVFVPLFGMVLIGSILEMSLLFQGRGKVTVTNSPSRSQHLGQRDANSTIPLKYNVLINSYMNSGSRFTGQLFGFRKDAFYFYEPLWKFSIWDYFHEPDQVCSSLKGAGKCQHRTARDVNYIYQKGAPGNKLSLIPNLNKNATLIDMMTDVLHQIYHCNFTHIKNMVVRGVQDNIGLAGEGWAQYKRCSKSKEECLRIQEHKCRSASHVVTKVLRLTTDSLEKLLRKNANLKVIQLFRDPRAIINSRLESRGYASSDVTLNSAALCYKMYLDYEGGNKLMKKFPGRFRFIFYDDIKTNLQDKMKQLYEFVGMDYDSAELEQLNKVLTNAPINRTPVTLKKRVLDNANWWRAQISFARYQSIMNQCKNLVQVFNMTKFKDIYQVQRLSIPALNLPDYMKVEVR